jgi:anti-sigma regulatory factor (Ser/Thr protein kinase)
MIQLLSHPGKLEAERSTAWRWSSVDLHAPREAPAEMEFTRTSLRAVRRFVALGAERARLGRGRREDLVLAVDELATNSVTYGGGRGELSLWCEAGEVRCEVRDRGHITDPLVGRRRPAPEQLTGRGLWVVGRLCDEVEIRSSPGRTVVRVHMRLNR